MSSTEALKPCPFCGGRAYISISDDEGNERSEEYENDPWSGLSFTIKHPHENNEDCPIASYYDECMGVYFYDSREEAIIAWNTRQERKLDTEKEEGGRKLNKNKIEAMRESLKIQGYDGNWNYDEYMHGMYNGMELMLAYAEGRAPIYREKPEKWSRDTESKSIKTTE